jgi:hypothetical protein
MTSAVDRGRLASPLAWANANEQCTEGCMPQDKELEQSLLEEFSVTELEDRFEFVMKCDENCGCPPKAPAPADTTVT